MYFFHFVFILERSQNQFINFYFFNFYFNFFLPSQKNAGLKGLITVLYALCNIAG